MMDTRRWGPGERLVFEPYTKEVYEETFKWIADHGIFADSGMGSGKYEEAVIRSRSNSIAVTDQLPVDAGSSAAPAMQARLTQGMHKPAKSGFNPGRCRSTRGLAWRQMAGSPARRPARRTRLFCQLQPTQT